MDFEIENAVRSYCSSKEYENLIHRYIQTEVFWNSFYRDNFRLKSLVNDEIRRSVPSKVRSECNSIVKVLVNEELELFARVHIPSHVMKAMNEQMPTYLNNHTQMAQILADHSTRLNHALRDSAEEILRKVVNEDQYHITTYRHIEAIKEMYTRNCEEMSEKHSNQLQSQEGVFQSKIKEFQSMISLEIKELHEANQKIKRLEGKVEELSQSSNTFRRIVFGSGIILVGGLLSVGVRIVASQMKTNASGPIEYYRM